MKCRVHLIIRGHVQGVFFRASTMETARALGLTGWVKNLPDGNVETIFEGPEEKVNRAVEWCRSGPPGAEVASIDETMLDYTGEYKSFAVRYN